MDKGIKRTRHPIEETIGRKWHFSILPLKCKRLKRLDLSSNLLELNPTLLQAGILSLRKLPNLVTLKIKDNPFCTVFPEYLTVDF